MQTQNVLARVNVHSLRPIFHRFLNSRVRVLDVATIRGLPSDAQYALTKAAGLADLLGDSTPSFQNMYIQRIVPYESTDPKLFEARRAVLCVSSENNMGGYIMTKTKSIELHTGVFGALPDDNTIWFVAGISAVNPYDDAYIDVVWFA